MAAKKPRGGKRQRKSSGGVSGMVSPSGVTSPVFVTYGGGGNGGIMPVIEHAVDIAARRAIEGTARQDWRFPPSRSRYK